MTPVPAVPVRKKKKSKPSCEVRDQRACNNQCVRYVQGPKKKDPKFWCCIACIALLARSGCRVHPATPDEVKPP